MLLYSPIMAHSEVSIEGILNSIATLQAKRGHSELELKTKLRRKFPAELVDLALKEAWERKWIEPQEVLTHKVTELLHRKNKGQRYIQQYLKKRGLGPYNKDESAELEKARYLIAVKFGTIPLTVECRPKAYRYLANRGFDDTTIKKVIYAKS